MRYLKQGFVAALGLAMAIATGSAANADGFPKKDVTHIIPWSAGGGTDAAMRRFMHHAEKQLGVKINSQNVKGAQSGIGVHKTMTSRPDGYTIGTLTWDSVITVPNNKLVPGYDLDKLSFLGTITLHSTALAVRADSPWKTIQDFIAAAKKNPGKLTISNVGTGGVWHLPALDMADKTGINVRHIPYPKGSAPQREALLSGETDAASISVASVFPAIKAGKARILAVMGNERDHALPDVPTFKELGYDVVWGSFRMVATQKKAPQEAKDKLEAAFAKVFKDPEFIKKAEETAMGAVWMNAKETETLVKTMGNKASALVADLKKRGLLK